LPQAGAFSTKTVLAQFAQVKREALRALLHQSPHLLWEKGQRVDACSGRRDLWSTQGLTEKLVGIETIRQALLRLGVGWQRAKHWIPSPDPVYQRKKRRDALSALAEANGWEIGYVDEVWWSRVSRPTMRNWSEQGEPRAYKN